MHGLSVLLTSALAVCASANPVDSNLSERFGGCLSYSEAQTVANNFRATIADTFSKSFVRSTFSKTFTDYSDSVNELINSGCPSGPAPLGSATFSSRRAFIKGQSSQAPIAFNILNIWHNCDTVILRWNSPNPGDPVPGTVSPQEPVTGIIVIEVVRNPDRSSSEPWLIQTVFSEFNSGAWLYDLGIFTPTCPATKRSVAAFGRIA
jgi:hypothetical protein